MVILVSHPLIILVYNMDGVNQSYGVNSVNDGLALAALVSQKGGYSYDCMGTSQMDGISDLRHEVSDVKAEVKDAECNIRHDVTKAESDIRRDVAKTEASLQTEVGNLKFQLHDNISVLGTNLNNRFGLVDVAVVRSEYESKLATQAAIKEISAKIDHESERTNDKIAHSQEEILEKLCECCEQTQLGFANLANESLKNRLADLEKENTLLSLKVKV